MASRKKSDVKAKVDELKQKSRRRLTKIKSAVKPTATTNTVSDNRLELLITTVNRGKTEFYLDLLQSFDVNMQFVALGHGTADAKMLERFGLNDSDKTVIFSVIKADRIADALAALDEKFRTIKNGKGIAYTVPMSGIIGTLIYGFLSNNKMAVKENNK